LAEGDGGEIDWLGQLVVTVRRWHDAALQAGSGAPGEHTDRLVASCARPFQSAFGEDAYPTDIDKAAALFHGIISSHAFVDGNKRTATFAVLIYLAARDLVDDISPLQVRLLGEVALETASTGLTVEEIAKWIHRIFDP